MLSKKNIKILRSVALLILVAALFMVAFDKIIFASFGFTTAGFLLLLSLFNEITKIFKNL